MPQEQWSGCDSVGQSSNERRRRLVLADRRSIQVHAPQRRFELRGEVGVVQRVVDRSDLDDDVRRVVAHGDAVNLLWADEAEAVEIVRRVAAVLEFRERGQRRRDVPQLDGAVVAARGEERAARLDVVDDALVRDDAAHVLVCHDVPHAQRGAGAGDEAPVGREDAVRRRVGRVQAQRLLQEAGDGVPEEDVAVLGGDGGLRAARDEGEVEQRGAGGDGVQRHLLVRRVAAADVPHDGADAGHDADQRAVAAVRAGADGVGLREVGRAHLEHVAVVAAHADALRLDNEDARGARVVRFADEDGVGGVDDGENLGGGDVDDDDLALDVARREVGGGDDAAVVVGDAVDVLLGRRGRRRNCRCCGGIDEGDASEGGTARSEDFVAERRGTVFDFRDVRRAFWALARESPHSTVVREHDERSRRQAGGNDATENGVRFETD